MSLEHPHAPSTPAAFLPPPQPHLQARAGAVPQANACQPGGLRCVLVGWGPGVLCRTRGDREKPIGMGATSPPAARFEGHAHALMLQQRRTSCPPPGRVGDGAPPGTPVPHSPPLGPGTIRARRRGRAPARWRGRPWSPPEIPAASASRPRSAKDSRCSTALPGEGDAEHPGTEHPRAPAAPTPSRTAAGVHPHRHSLGFPTKPPMPAAREQCHGGCDATSGALTWTGGSRRGCGGLQCGGRRHLPEPRRGRGAQDCLLNPSASGKQKPLEHPHLVHHGENPIYPLLRCVLLLGKLHCVSLRRQDGTRSRTRRCPAWTVSPDEDRGLNPAPPRIRTGR